VQRDSTAVFTIALTITAAAFVALLYADGSLHRLQQHFFPTEQTPPPPAVPEAQGTTSVAPVQQPQAPGKSILKCTDERVGTFYTNEGRCEDADLNNTVSVIDALPGPPQRDTGSVSQSNKAGSFGSTRSASSRQTSSTVPGSMTVGCKWVIGRAQEVETLLNLKNPPKQSVWKPNYCRWVCEAWVKQCGDPGDYLERAGECGRPSRNISDRECSSYAASLAN
jgi:hypothetical protein